MKEININIEGYNVNGICVGCLNYNRKMILQNKMNEIKECYKILGNIDIPDGLTIQVCWECLASIKHVMRFREQILNSMDVLLQYSQKNLFLNSPEDLSQYATQRLQIDKVINISEPESVNVKEEDKIIVNDVKEEAEGKINIFEVPEPEVKVEEIEYGDHNYQETDFIDTLSTGKSSDDDIQLSKLKTVPKEKKKKKKLKDKKRKKIEKELVDKNGEKVIRRLKNLPSDVVELHTMTENEMWETRNADVASHEFQRLKYKCELCIMVFNTKKLMETHENGRHNPKSEDVYQCDVCKSFFLTKDNVAVHRRLHFNAYKCRECGFVTTMKRLVMAHDCTTKKGYPCSRCYRTFSSKSKLWYHKRVSHQQNPQCDCCGKVFANKMTLKYHLKILPQNKSEKTEEKLFIPCKGCDKVFYSKKSYRAHVVIHDGVRYPCPTCGKLFQWKRNLGRHVRNHMEREAGATHTCRECGKTFASRDCYNNHMRLSKRHVQEDQYVHACHFCGKKFPTKWCMVDHIDWDHLKRIKYQCSVCFKPFKTAKIMVAHMNNIHKGKNKKDQDSEHEHLCDICGKSYKTVKRLKGHVWAMHTQRADSKSFKCTLCPATFAWQTSIYKHMKMMHDNKRNKPPRALPAKKPEPFPAVELANRMQYFQQNMTTGLVQNMAPGAPPPLNIVQNI